MNNLLAKHRPRRLADVLGQPAVEVLQLFARDPYPHAMLFHGNTGVGKTSAAYALAAELGCSVEDSELGGFIEIPSGEMDADSVRTVMRLLQYRPLMGSGWRVLVANECERMSKAAETIWLDALEHLPPKSVVVFTTNAQEKLSQRFRDRCEVFHFVSQREAIQPAIWELARRVWREEVGKGEPPSHLSESLGMPQLGDLDNFHASFRLALQQLQPLVRAAQARRNRAAGLRAWLAKQR